MKLTMLALQVFVKINPWITRIGDNDEWRQNDFIAYFNGSDFYPDDLTYKYTFIRITRFLLERPIIFGQMQRDNAENIEAEHVNYDAMTRVYANLFQGNVFDIRGTPIFKTNIELSPSSWEEPLADENGYFERHIAQDTFSISPHHIGYSTLPTKNFSGDSQFDWYLPPIDDLVINGEFERENDNEWLLQGVIPPVISSFPHTGNYGLIFGGGEAFPPVPDASASQLLTIPADMPNATLSFMYKFPQSDGSKNFKVLVNNVEKFSTSDPTSTWAHVWIDVSDFAGQDVIIEFRFEENGGTSGWLYLDDVSLGSWVTPIIHYAAPVALQTNWAGQTISLDVENYVDDSTFYLGDYAVSIAPDGNSYLLTIPSESRLDGTRFGWKPLPGSPLRIRSKLTWEVLFIYPMWSRVGKCDGKLATVDHFC